MKLLSLDGRLLSLRERAKEVRDPTAADETLEYILNLIEKSRPQSILEIGAAEGLTSCAMLLCSDAHLTAIEYDSARASRARENFRLFGLEERVKLHEGDAGEILPMLEGEYDLIFLDGPKVQYRRYLPDCKRLLSRGGVLLSDDILLFGWVRGEPPKKRRMLVEHIREYLKLLETDEELETEILEIAEGLAVSVKK
ncbi:MAG: class I SAM-dependent methyltransferase [Clostridia bacterium]|nr:class I SAM-dependent methyltransferase [Clostridia bacterium]